MGSLFLYWYHQTHLDLTNTYMHYFEIIMMFCSSVSDNFSDSLLKAQYQEKEGNVLHKKPKTLFEALSHSEVSYA